MFAWDSFLYKSTGSRELVKGVENDIQNKETV